VEGLGIDYIIFKPRADLLSKLLLREDIYTEKGLERASSICTTCMGLVNFIALRMALESDIPLITYGWSPGQAPIEPSILPNNPSMIQGMQDQLLDPMRKIAGAEVENYFLTPEHFEMRDRFPHNLSPLAFLEYDEEEILKRSRHTDGRNPTTQIRIRRTASSTPSASTSTGRDSDTIHMRSSWPVLSARGT
jgi:hypothetical protein